MRRRAGDRHCGRLLDSVEVVGGGAGGPHHLGVDLEIKCQGHLGINVQVNGGLTVILVRGVAECVVGEGLRDRGAVAHAAALHWGEATVGSYGKLQPVCQKRCGSSGALAICPAERAPATARTIEALPQRAADPVHTVPPNGSCERIVLVVVGGETGGLGMAATSARMVEGRRNSEA